MSAKYFIPQNSCLDIQKLEQTLLKCNINIKDNNTEKIIPISFEQICELIKLTKRILLDQPIILELQAPLKVVGDIHGHMKELSMIFKVCGHPSNNNYLFLGNYVDKGQFSIQVLCLLMVYKIKYPQNFFMLRGNHEITENNRIFGLYEDCKKKYNLFLWKQINDMFNYLPLCAIIDHHIFCVHSGLSPQLPKYQEIQKISRPYQIFRSQGIGFNLLTSEPEASINGYVQQQFGQGCQFGYDVLHQWTVENNVDLVLRGNCVLEYGVQFFYNKKLISICSIPNMEGLDNLGAVVCIAQQLQCQFQIIKSSSSS